MQADRAADTVARGGSVAGWSLSKASLTAGVHREETKKPSDDEKLKEAAKKTAEAALKTEAGTALKERVLADPLVKAATSFVDTTPGKVVAGGVAAAGVTALAATGQSLPFQAPAIPLDRITPGLSAEVTVEGPLNAPTFVGLSLAYKEQGGAGKKGPTKSDRIAADTARLRAQQQSMVPQAERDRQRAEEQSAAVAYMLAQQRARFSTSTLIPLLPGTKPKTIEAPAAPTEAEKKDDAQAPVQREPATAAAADAPQFDTAGVDDAVGDSGRALDPAVRHSMEARFGQDFSHVRLHAGSTATHAAAGIDAAAFTVGNDIAFADGIPDAATYAGRHLLAHELAHVVQQRAARPTRGGVAPVHRRPAGEWLGIFFGTEEGNWTDKELRDYLLKVTTTNGIDGAFDADNKARALVRKWKAGAPGWELSGRQKGLLIDEMLDGPTGDDDEDAILDVLELSDSGDLRTIFHTPQKRWENLDSDLDWSQNDRLHTFAARRFRGGIAALKRGEADPIGAVIPAGAPSFAFDRARLLARFDADDESDDIIGVIEALSDADRRAVLDHLLHKTWPATVTERGNARLTFAQATDEAKKPLAARLVALRTKLKKLKSVILHFFLGDLPATTAELLKATKPVKAADAQAVRDVLKPQQFQAAQDDIIDLDEPEDEPAAKPAKTDAEASKTPAPGKPKPKTAAERKAEAAKKKADEKKEAKKKAEAEEKRLGAGSDYRKKLQKILADTTEERFQRHVVSGGKHAKSGLVEAMAPFAKDLTDDVFGAYYKASEHPAMTFGTKDRPGNLHSWFDTSGGELAAMTPAQRQREAKSWARYYCQAVTDIRVLNDQYDAEPEFDDDDKPTNVAARTQVAVIDDLTKDGASKDGLDDPTTVVDKLNTTERAWPGMARGKDVYVDLYLTRHRTENRRARWRKLQTLVHEYVHTLVAGPYEKYAESFGDSSVQYNTLIEGVDEVFAGMVWQHIAPQAERADLRVAVEGKADATLPALRIEAPGHYDSFDEAMRLVQIVGIRSLTAAYFAGAVDRVRSSVPPPAKKGAP
jgi:hypothetical protein